MEATAQVWNSGKRWTFLTRHALVLYNVWQNPEATVRSIAAAVQISERQTTSILRAMRLDGYISVERRGRHNRYSVNEARPYRRVAPSPMTVGQFLQTIEPALGAEAS